MNVPGIINKIAVTALCNASSEVCNSQFKRTNESNAFLKTHPDKARDRKISKKERGWLNEGQDRLIINIIWTAHQLQNCSLDAVRMQL